MAQIVNLNRFRKDKARSAARTQADANAARHGRTGAEKARDRAKAEKAARDLDGHQRDDPRD